MSKNSPRSLGGEVSSGNGEGGALWTLDRLGGSALSRGTIHRAVLVGPGREDAFGSRGVVGPPSRSLPAGQQDFLGIGGPRASLAS